MTFLYLNANRIKRDFHSGLSVYGESKNSTPVINLWTEVCTLSFYVLFANHFQI